MNNNNDQLEQSINVDEKFEIFRQLITPLKKINEILIKLNSSFQDLKKYFKNANKQCGCTGEK